MHLDPHRYAALVGGTLPPEEARILADHLSGDCEECEQFLAERATADALDGATDAAIAAALPPRASSSNELEFARIERRLRDPRPVRRRVLLMPAAIAAAIAVAGLAGLLAHRQPPAGPPVADSDGVKGSEARPLRVRLRFALLDPAGEPVKGEPGETLGRNAKLLFELELDRAADVALARVSPGAETELFWRGRLGSGRSVVTMGGKTAAYPLASLSGPQRFVAIAAEGGLDEARLARTVAAFRPTRLEVVSQLFHDVSFDAVEVNVR